jgi:hypothetical protein
MAIIVGRKFIFGIPTQEELLTIWQSLLSTSDEMIASPEEFLKVRRDHMEYAVEKTDGGYSLFRITPT